jgi:hypothetical protein
LPKHVQGKLTARKPTGDTGIGILPGVVCVDLTVANAQTITVTDLREAFDEATAQDAQSNLDASEVLGDLDLHPL